MVGTDSDNNIPPSVDESGMSLLETCREVCRKICYVFNKVNTMCPYGGLATIRLSFLLFYGCATCCLLFIGLKHKSPSLDVLIIP